MTLLFSMTFCGSLLFLAVEAIIAVLGARLSGRVRYRMYKAVLAAYLLPIPYCKFLIYDILDRVSGLQFYGLHLPTEMNYLGAITVPTGGGSFVVITLTDVVLIVIPVLVGIVLLSRELFKYCRYRDAYLIDAEAAGYYGQDRTGEQSVPCYRSSLLNTPIAMGIFKPKILVPLMDYDGEAFQMILAHESVHVKGKDNLWKMIMLTACAVHWYNPLIYLLYRRMDVCCEFACDESVADRLHMDTEAVKCYLNLLIQTAEGAHGSVPMKRSVSGLSYTNKKKMLEKRVENMLNKKKSKVVGRIACLILAVCFMMASAVGAWAYDASNDRTYHFNDTEDMEYTLAHLDEETVEFGSAMWKQTNGEMEFYKSLPFDECDTVCVDENGSIYPADEYPLYMLGESTEMLAPCFHTYTTYTEYTHKKDSKGGCTITEFLCTKCVKCGYYADRTFVSQLTYAKCPH